MNTYDFRVTPGSQDYTHRICAESYTIASNIIHCLLPLAAIISPAK
jgi:hypothetical protein